jgi:hypothetical protein
MDDDGLARAYLDVLVARDWDGFRSLLGDSFRLRDLSPHGFTQVDDPDQVVDGFRDFLGKFETVSLLDADVYAYAGRTYLRARLHVVHAEAGERVLEQHHLVTVEDGRITEVDQLCTGLHAP